METGKEEEKKIVISPSDEEEDTGEDNKKQRTLSISGKMASSSAGASTQCFCQVENCSMDMTDVKPYYRRHKVCAFHAKALVILIAGQQKRFCQQCSRFHDLTEFDEAKRSCRRRLAGHNKRRRKSLYDSH